MGLAVPGALPQAIAFLPFRQTPGRQDKLFMTIIVGNPADHCLGYNRFNGLRMVKQHRGETVETVQGECVLRHAIPAMNRGVND